MANTRAWHELEHPWQHAKTCTQHRGKNDIGVYASGGSETQRRGNGLRLRRDVPQRFGR
jgi:hypothetical protein